MSRILTLNEPSPVKRRPIEIIEPPTENNTQDEDGGGAGTTAPQDPDSRYEYDVLYENQRGVLWFGVPKFSPSTLLQWDPSPWTDIDHRDSPYNIVTAQLPDDSWEWVYPEWLIDMTGDTDESGWQYAGSFGQRFIPLLAGPFQALFGGGKVKAEEERRARRAERLERKHARAKRNEETRADEGIEALKRFAQARRAKWRGRPNANCFVRRRRWVRLRRKKAPDT
ncbi:hypothetical protein V8E36_004426 [Tilletia maclaganii]